MTPSLSPSSIWEQMVVTNLQFYYSILSSRKPLFTVDTLLSSPEIVLLPQASELCKMLMATTRKIVER